MNWIFFGLIVVAVVTAAFTGRVPLVTSESIRAAKSAVELAIGLVGQMALWLGFMGILREAGLMRSIARLLEPIMKRLFPQVPPEHPAMGAMIMNFAANILGLGNAATPFGLKAMHELDKLNPRKGVATDAMALFLVINTSGLAVLPLGVVAVRASMGSRDPAGIVVPSIIGTFISTMLGIAIVKILERRRAFAPERYALEGGAAPGDGKLPDQAALAEAEKAAAPREPANLPRKVAIVAVLGLVAFAAGRYAVRTCDSDATCGAGQVCRAGSCLPAADPCASVTACPAGQVCREGKCQVVPCGPTRPCQGNEVCRAEGCSPAEESMLQVARTWMSDWLLPLLMVGIVLFGMGRRVRVYEAFVAAAKEGFQIAVVIIPYLVAILVTIGMLRASGAMEAFTSAIGPALETIGFPAAAVPMALIRPLSGTGALGVMIETMQAHGPDSFVGYLVSLINGSSETTFYVLAVYFGAVQVRAVRHTLPACLLSDFVGLCLTVLLAHLFFG